MSLTPTDEQQAVIDAFTAGHHIKLEAFAGTGKTSTCKLVTRTTRARGIYLAFNSATARDARGPGAFPRNIECRTAHSFGYRWLVEQWGEDAVRHRLQGSRMPPYAVAKHLGVTGPVRVGAGEETKFLGPNQIARITQDAVRLFCQSDDDEIAAHHVPRQRGMERPEDHQLLVDAVLPYVHKAWADLTRPDGTLRWNHDCYLKMWAMTRPILPADFILLDEAQDTNDVVAGLFKRQPAQLLAVGDSCQAIYGWRGAKDFLSQMEAHSHLFLTQSWRFGPAVAQEANKWLRLLDVDRPVKGSPHMTSILAPLAHPDAVLCRTNAEAVAALMTYQADRVPTCIVGGGDDFKRLAVAAEELQATGRTNHPEFAAFTSWNQVQDYVTESADGADLAVAVDLIDDWGADAITNAIDAQCTEENAQIVVTTAHKAKGREWARVKIAEDFRAPQPDEFGRPVLPPREEMMLAYVSVTRAREVLDPEGLSWVNDYVAHAAAARARVERQAREAAGVPAFVPTEAEKRAAVRVLDNLVRDCVRGA